MKVTALLNTQSAARKNSAAAIDIMRTAAVVTTVSLRVGQVTLDTSVRTCWRNSKGFITYIPNLCRIDLPRSPASPRTFELPRLVAGVEGLEPPTPGFGDRCSSQLSYTPTPAPSSNRTANLTSVTEAWAA